MLSRILVDRGDQLPLKALGGLQPLRFECTYCQERTQTAMKALGTILTLGIALLAMPFSAHTMDDDKLDAVEQLRGIKLYAFGGIGFAGTISSGEKLYQEILQRPTATVDFAKVAEKGTPEAKMYALHALARLSPDHYRKLKKTTNREQKVATMQGCLMMEQTVGDILDGIEEQVQKGTE